MRFHYWLEKKKFEEDWEQKRIEYAAAGMPGADIQRMYEFDWALFRQERIYQTRNYPLEPAYLQKRTDASDKSRWLLRYSNALSQTNLHDADDLSTIPNQTENPKMLSLFQQMDHTDIRLLYLLLDGYKQAESALRLGISQQAVSKRIIKMKKLLM